ncbi:MAG TPA: DUF502 domain-containing protein [Xanthomonadales bacterium]|nr:DUF502 domain-containing protein [Xanthomonadales bacterium]
MWHHRRMPLADRLAALRLQRYLITGALTLLPLWLTWIVFSFVLGLLSGISAPWIAAIAAPLATAFPLALGWLDAPWVQSAIAVLVTVLAIYVVGWATNRVVGQRLIAGFDRLVARIPMVQTIYGGSKKLLDLMQTKPDGTHRVVLIEFPNSEMKTVGLVTRTMRDADTGREYAAVYVPTTPNPTSGYLEIVPLDRVTPTDWTMDQAMAFIISGGAIAPARFRFGAAPPTPIAPHDKD